MFANQSAGRIVEFGEDPNGRPTARGLLSGIWRRVQGARTHPYGPEKSDPSITFHGLATAPQNFKGFNVQLAQGKPYRNDAFASIDTGLVEGPMGDPARRIFAQRLARRTASGGSA